MQPFILEALKQFIYFVSYGVDFTELSIDSLDTTDAEVVSTCVPTSHALVAVEGPGRRRPERAVGRGPRGGPWGRPWGPVGGS